LKLFLKKKYSKIKIKKKSILLLEIKKKITYKFFKLLLLHQYDKLYISKVVRIKQLKEGLVLIVT